MIYKFETKDYIITSICCAIPLGIFMGLLTNNITLAIIESAAVVMFSSLSGALTSRKIVKMLEPLRVEINKVRKIICEGPANHKIGAKAAIGWMFLTEDALEFYLSQTNTDGENIPILLDDIVNVEAKFNQLTIKTKERELKFVVNKAKSWENTIKRYL